jgi:hypothetical protein
MTAIYENIDEHDPHVRFRSALEIEGNVHIAQRHK